ncbi:MAG: alpha/beta hydrolase [Planctomycetota bacterium]|jgi:pimeloyl-ACP methyl ester carboxylesterase
MRTGQGTPLERVADKTAGAPRRRRWRYAIAAVVLLAAVFIGLDQWLPYMLLSHHKFSVDPHPAILDDYGATVERISFVTGDGVAISGWFIPTGPGSRGEVVTLVVLHTLGRTRQDMLQFSLPLWKKGCNLALIDMRGHGESGGKYFTYGHHEWHDVVGLVDYLEQRNDGSASNVVVMGASAGGAVAIAAAARDSRIKGLVSIASFADLSRTIRHQASWLPEFWLRRAMRKAERIGGFEIGRTSPVEDIRKVASPVLIVHGAEDTYVPYEDAEELYDGAAGEKELFAIPAADHATMFSRGGEQLTDRIYSFAERACRKR